MASRKAGVISINLNAGTAQFLADMDRANAKIILFGQRARETSGALRGIGDAGSHSVSGVQATSGALRVLEGGMTNNLRAAERFTANILGLGPILQKAFPLIGGLAFGGLIIKLGEEVTKFYAQMRDAPEKSITAFRTLNAETRNANNLMALSNVQLQNQINKLEGKRQNTLKEAIYEARVEADKLAESLGRGLTSLYETLDKNKPSTTRRVLDLTMGGLPLSASGQLERLQRDIGGNAGGQGQTGRIAAINSTANTELGIAAAMPQANKAEALLASQAKEEAELKRNKALLWEYDNTLADTNATLKIFTDLREKQWADEAKRPSLEQYKKMTDEQRADVDLINKNPLGKVDYSTYINPLIAIREQQEAERVKIEQFMTRTNLTSKVRQAEANNISGAQERPLDKMTAELTSRVAEAKAKLDAAGGDEAGKVIARGMSEAAKAITTVNDRLRIQKQALLDVNPTKSTTGRSFLSLTTKEASYESEAAFKDKVQEVNSKLSDQLKNQRMINEAIGQGWEAMAKVNAELLVMHDFTPTQYNDPSHAAEIQAARERALAVEIAKHTEETNRANLTTRDQITLETRLAQVESAGSEAVRLATLQHTIAIMRRNGATQESIQLAIDLNSAQRANEVSKQIADIDQQIAALNRLSAAYGQGEEAVRKAELENKLKALERQGPASITGSQAIILANTEAENKAAEAAGKRVTQYADQLHQLQLENDELDKMLKNGVNVADIERTRREILDAELKIMVQQQIAQRDSMSGMRAFFLEMQQQAKSAAAIQYEALNSTLDRTADNLTKLLTGQKTAWAKMFQDIGRDLTKQTIKSGLQTGLGKLGDLIPGVKGAKDAAKKAADLSKIGHTEANPWYVKVVGNTGKDKGPNSTPGTGPGNILFGNSGLLGTGQVPKATGGFLNSLKGIFGGLSGGASSGIGAASSTISYGGEAASGIGDAVDLSTEAVGAMASGGDVQPNQVYSWNENGKELFMSGAGGHIANAAQTRQMLGGSRGGDTYIDARGTDPGAVEQRVRVAMRDTYGASVSSSVRAYHQQAARTPQRA